jgi:hypothetical protein
MAQPEGEKTDHKLIAHLYRQLARDAKRVATRQYKYSKEALGERRFSTKDFALAKREGLLGSMLDDKHESDICNEFAKYRRDVADLFKKRSDFYLKQAKKYERL